MFNHRPTEAQTLLLRAALCQDDRAPAVWRVWRFAADLDQLPAGGFPLLPLVAYNLQRHAFVDPVLDKCQGIHRRTWTQNQSLVQSLLPLLHALHQTGITPILQGDLALALFHYPEQGLRMINTVDLLTPPVQANAVPPLLTQSGWQPKPAKHHWLRTLLVGAASPQRFAHPQLRNTSLLWQRLPPPPDTPLVDERDQQRNPLRVRELAVQCVNPTDLFCALCVRGIVSLQWYSAIQWIADAAMLLQGAAPAIDWERVVTRSRQQAVTLRMAAALNCLVQSIDASIPPTILRTLATQPSRPVERWEAQLFARQPTAARRLTALGLDSSYRTGRFFS